MQIEVALTFSSVYLRASLKSSSRSKRSKVSSRCNRVVCATSEANSMLKCSVVSRREGVALSKTKVRRGEGKKPMLKKKKRKERKKEKAKTCIVASIARTRATFKFCVSLHFRLQENDSICVFSFS